MTRSAGRTVLAVVIAMIGAIGLATAGDSQPPPQWLFTGLPPQEPGSARLGLQDAADIRVDVSIRRKTMACDELEAVVHVVQGGATHAESRGCLGADKLETRTDLVLGYGQSRQFFELGFSYSPTEQTVTYSITRVAGSGVIESQRVSVDVGPTQ